MLTVLIFDPTTLRAFLGSKSRSRKSLQKQIIHQRMENQTTERRLGCGLLTIHLAPVTEFPKKNWGSGFLCNLLNFRLTQSQNYNWADIPTC